ncbi:hypothetical protein ACHAW6_002658, partial [Cyclotella cf. meneghiniana]
IQTQQQGQQEWHGFCCRHQGHVRAASIWAPCQQTPGKTFKSTQLLQSKLVPSLWRHKTHPIQFVLTVDDFGVKYVSREHFEHLYCILCQHYTVTTDWAGELYIGIHLQWDYESHQVHLFMPRYVQKALTIIHHKQHVNKTNLSPHMPIKFGDKKQYA